MLADCLEHVRTMWRVLRRRHCLLSRSNGWRRKRYMHSVLEVAISSCYLKHNVASALTLHTVPVNALDCSLSLLNHYSRFPFVLPPCMRSLCMVAHYALGSIRSESHPLSRGAKFIVIQIMQYFGLPLSESSNTRPFENALIWVKSDKVLRV